MIRTFLPLAGVTLALAGCTQIGTPGGSSFYECDQGTRLRVDYRGPNAIVRVNEGRVMTLRSTPSTGGAVLEGRRGQRLARQGNIVIWNTAARTAPETCRQIMIPR